MSELSLHEAIFTLRAMRRLKTDPIPVEDLRYIVEAATLTTLHKAREQDIKNILAIPDNVTTIALIPLGYPEGRWVVPFMNRPSGDKA